VHVMHGGNIVGSVTNGFQLVSQARARRSYRFNRRLFIHLTLTAFCPPIDSIMRLMFKCLEDNGEDYQNCH